MTAKKLRPRGWTPTMGQRLTDLEARQVKCLTADAGHIWMPTYDALPPVVRRRLANSPYNICAACMDIEAHRMGRKPSLAAYFAAIETIEKQLKATEEE
jgi:hypothetical protein